MKIKSAKQLKYVSLFMIFFAIFGIVTSYITPGNGSGRYSGNAFPITIICFSFLYVVVSKTIEITSEGIYVKCLFSSRLIPWDNFIVKTYLNNKKEEDYAFIFSTKERKIYNSTEAMFRSAFQPFKYVVLAVGNPDSKVTICTVREEDILNVLKKYHIEYEEIDFKNRKSFIDVNTSWMIKGRYLLFFTIMLMGVLICLNEPQDGFTTFYKVFAIYCLIVFIHLSKEYEITNEGINMTWFFVEKFISWDDFKGKYYLRRDNVNVRFYIYDMITFDLGPIPYKADLIYFVFSTKKSRLIRVLDPLLYTMLHPFSSAYFGAYKFKPTKNDGPYKVDEEELRNLLNKHNIKLEEFIKSKDENE